MVDISLREYPLATGELDLAAIATHRINGSLSSIIIIGFVSGEGFRHGAEIREGLFFSLLSLLLDSSSSIDLFPFLLILERERERELIVGGVVDWSEVKSCK